LSTDVKVYDNGDRTRLVWLPAGGKAIASCRGFTIRRLLGGKESYLHGFAGFFDDDKLDPTVHGGCRCSVPPRGAGRQEEGKKKSRN
jgi:hypothetical protein